MCHVVLGSSFEFPGPQVSIAHPKTFAGIDLLVASREYGTVIPMLFPI